MDQAAAPYRVASLRCPRCPATGLGDGKLHHCDTCGGTWIDEQTLSEQVAKMGDASPAKLEWSVSTDRRGLPCALCRRHMEPLLLFGVPVDRCQAHGAWFDSGELARVLERNAPVVVSGETAGEVVAWDAGVEVASVGAEVAAEAGGGVLDAVLEVIGGIFSVIDV